MIKLQDVSKVFLTGRHLLTVLHPFTLQIPRGQFLAILGPSGSGKSTLLGLIAGLDTPTTGSIWLDGDEITKLNEDELARLRGQKIGFVFQSFHLIPTLTAQENVQVPLELLGDEEAERKATALLTRVGLIDRRDHYPVQLSGGEQQRVALARAFACQPSLLLADEPTGNLDSANGDLVIQYLFELNREHQTTMVLVTHDPTLSSLADRVITLRDGRIIQDELNSTPSSHYEAPR